MNITRYKLADLVIPDYNPRTISKEEYAGLLESLRTFGYVDLLVVNKRNKHIVGGNQRSRALKELGYTDIDVVEVDVDDHDEKKLNVILNSQAISGVYDDLKLSELLESFKGDSDYQTLRLDELEPLDLSGNGEDTNSAQIKDYVITVRFDDQRELENALEEIQFVLNRYDCDVSVNTDETE